MHIIAKPKSTSPRQHRGSTVETITLAPIILFCSHEYISITMSSNGNLTTQVYSVQLFFNIWDMCPAKSGLWGYNFITIKIARCTKQHIFTTVLPFPFKFRTLVPTPFLCVKTDFWDLHLFRAVDTTIVNLAG